MAETLQQEAESAETEGSRKLFRWYHWVIIIGYSLTRIPVSGIGGAVGTFVGMFIMFAILVHVWRYFTGS